MFPMDIFSRTVAGERQMRRLLRFSGCRSVCGVLCALSLQVITICRSHTTLTNLRCPPFPAISLCCGVIPVDDDDDVSSTSIVELEEIIGIAGNSGHGHVFIIVSKSLRSSSSEEFPDGCWC